MTSTQHVIAAFAVAALLASPVAAQDTVKAGATETKDGVVKGTKAVVHATEAGLSKTGEVITDGWITTRVHERFVTEDLLKNSNITVDTDKHVVTLKGTVMTSAGRK